MFHYKMNRIFWIIGCLIFLTASQGVPFVSYISQKDLIQVGKVTFNDISRSPTANLINGAVNRQLCTDVGIAFTIPFSGISVAVAIYSFGSYSTQVYGSDYSINAKQKPSTNSITITLLIGGAGSSWTNLIVSYLAESRSDLWAGTFFADMGNTFSCNEAGSQTLTTSLIIPGWALVNSLSVTSVAVYICGLRSQMSQFGFSLSNSMNGQTGNLTVTIAIPTPKIAIELIKLSYVIAQSSSLYPSLTQIIVYPLDPRDVSIYDYNFQGASSLVSPSGILFISTLGIKSDNYVCAGIGCTTPYFTSAACAASGGVIVGNACNICQGANQFYNTATGQCVCLGSSMLSNGLCIPCGVNFILVNNMCTCPPGYKIVSGQCQADNQPIQPAQPSCGAFATYSAQAGSCVCLYSNMNLNTATQSCSCSVPNQLVYNQRCMCPYTNFIDGFGNCRSCALNQIQSSVDPTRCACMDNTVLYNGVCTQNPCKLNAIWSIYYVSCRCRYNLANMDSNGNCACPALYLANPATGMCQCNPAIAYTSVVGVCTQSIFKNCPAGMVFSPSLQRCTCINPDQYYSTQGKCLCKDQMVPNRDNTGCVCSANTILYKGICTGCGPNSVYDSSTFSCICLTGYDYYQSSVCVRIPSCVNGATYDNTTDSCKCNLPSTILLATGCGCPGSTTLNSKQECVCGGVFALNSTSQLCSCLSGYNYVSGSGCMSTSVTPTTSVILLSSTFNATHGCSAVCISQYLYGTPCNSCSYLLNVTTILPTNFVPDSIQVTPVPNYNGCFLVLFKSPLIMTTRITFSTVVSSNGGKDWMKGPNFVEDPFGNYGANFPFANYASNLTQLFQKILGNQAYIDAVSF